MSLHKLYERVTTKLYSISSKIANHYRSKILEARCLTKKGYSLVWRVVILGFACMNYQYFL
nr:MAG TPA: hypothetical protein [Caudoviricetes sp.]